MQHNHIVSTNKHPLLIKLRDLQSNKNSLTKYRCQLVLIMSKRKTKAVLLKRISVKIILYYSRTIHFIVCFLIL